DHRVSPPLFDIAAGISSDGPAPPLGGLSLRGFGLTWTIAIRRLEHVGDMLVCGACRILNGIVRRDAGWNGFDDTRRIGVVEERDGIAITRRVVISYPMKVRVVEA